MGSEPAPRVAALVFWRQNGPQTTIPMSGVCWEGLHVVLLGGALDLKFQGFKSDFLALDCRSNIRTMPHALDAYVVRALNGALSQKGVDAEE